MIGRSKRGSFQFMRFKMFVAAGLLAGAATSVSAQVMPLDQAAKAFGTRESVQSIAISPSGNRLVLISAGPGRSSLIRIVELPAMSTRTILTSAGDPESFRWCDFASDTQIICRYAGNGLLGNDVVSFGRLVTFDSDGKNLQELGQRRSFYDAGLRQFDGSILDWLPGQNGSVLMERAYVAEAYKMNTRIVRDKEGLGVDRVELPSLKSEPVEQPNRGVSSYMSDGRGNVRLMKSAGTTAAGQLLSGEFRFHYRVNGSKDWEPLGQYDANNDTGIRPLEIDGSSNSLYLLKKLNGRDALYRQALDLGGAETLVASDKSVDIDDVVRFGHGQRVIGYTYATEQRHAVYFDPEFKKLSDSLGKALPNQPLVDFIGSSSDGSKLLIFAGGDTLPGSYYLFDRNSRALNELSLVRPELEGKALASVRSITYPAADGVQVPAYLTLPPGKEAKGLPAIVLPHGGPSARDEWGFDWLAQFLVARGYAVIQPNYRGSAGYGEDWLSENGFRNWRASISDINAAANYLTAQGIADPKKLAIVGWSYGGYAALQSVATDPALYRASIAIAPVTDLSLMKQDSKNFTNSKMVSQFVGSGDHVTAGSPLRNADKIKVPVLLVHGDLDTNVSIAHSEKMAGALPQAEFIRYQGLDHYLDDSNARVEMLTKIGQMLDRTIGQ
jgi:dipeptidyl aminopeptidase/acylaminoacyl peptidase